LRNSESREVLLSSKLMDDKLARLREIGFTAIGRWMIVDGGIKCELNELGYARNVLYAFAVDGKLEYIGKTAQPLRSRLAGYRKPARTQSTNIKNNGKILDAWQKDKRLKLIYSLTMVYSAMEHFT
jgi:hypothetical protein